MIRANTLFNQPADVGIIGDTAMQRIVIACKLRRAGLAVHADLQQRKRAKAFAAALLESCKVLDLDSIAGQERLRELQRR